MATSPFSDEKNSFRVINETSEMLMALSGVETLGKAIATLREYKGLSQECFENKLSFGIRTLQRIESDKLKYLDFTKILEMCVVLKLPFSVSH